MLYHDVCRSGSTFYFYVFHAYVWQVGGVDGFYVLIGDIGSYTTQMLHPLFIAELGGFCEAVFCQSTAESLSAFPRFLFLLIAPAGDEQSHKDK